jgi:hypothetical protein
MARRPKPPRSRCIVSRTWNPEDTGSPARSYVTADPESPILARSELRRVAARREKSPTCHPPGARASIV